MEGPLGNWLNVGPLVPGQSPLVLLGLQICVGTQGGNRALLESGIVGYPSDVITRSRHVELMKSGG